MALLLSSLIAFAAFSACALFLPRQQSTAPVPAHASGPGSVIDCVYRVPEHRFWTYFTSGPGATVYGYPSKGGVYILNYCFAVELDFLGLSRVENTKRPSTSYPYKHHKEDEHCARSHLPSYTFILP